MVAIFVILTIAVFLTIDIVYQRVRQRKAAEAQPNSLYARAEPIDRIRVPEGLFFHPGHTWAAVTASGMTKVGIDDFLRKLIGKIDSIEFAKTKGEVEQGEPLFVIRQGVRTFEVPAPVGGIIEAVNIRVSEDPSLLKMDTYENGWLAAIRPKNLKSNIEKLNIADSAKTWMQDELTRLRDFFAGVSFDDKLVGQTLHDGGPPVEGVLQHMNDKAVHEFKSQFLKRS